MTVRVVSTPLTGSLLAEAANPGNNGHGWYAERPASAGDWTRRGDAARESLASRDWLADLAPAFDATGEASRRLERAAHSGFAVTTGQQPGLFGGPLYTWWKALSALSLANQLERVTGYPVAPIFWAATDDSDLAEASATTVAPHEVAVIIEIADAAKTGLALAHTPLGDVTAQLSQLVLASGSAPHARFLDLVRQAYADGRTVGGSYVALLRSVLHPMGIAVLDASHWATRNSAYPILLRALEAAGQIEQSLEERSTSLKAAGHPTQVKLVRGRSLVFSDTESRRERVKIRDAAGIAASGLPGGLGPNVLLRPIVERSILPTVAYVGGPAEIAYFAQVSAVAAALGGETPLILPRWSGMVVEPRIDRILGRHGLSVDDFRDPHAIETTMARESIPPAVAAGIADARESMHSATEKLLGADGSALISPTIIEGLRQTLGHRMDRLERRYAAAIKRRGGGALNDVAIARASLFPNGVPQERSLNLIPLLARHGEDLFTQVLREIDPHTASMT